MSIHENTKYQYIRLNDGKEILAMISEIGEKIEMYLPMSRMCKAAASGIGVTIHLGPMVPFTHDEFVTIDNKDISFRTSITDQFIQFYDDAVTNWLELRDSGKMQIRTQKQEHENESTEIKRLISDRLKETLSWEDYDNELEEEYLKNKDLPTSEDIIH